MQIPSDISKLHLGFAGSLHDTQTPALVLDVDKAASNMARMKNRAARLGVRLRPHMKTAKSVAVLHRLGGGPSMPIAVSTLKEAEVFAAAGSVDILYAVGIAPDKLPRVTAIRRSGCDLSVVLDSEAVATAVAQHSRKTGDRIPVLLEIDADGHRAGLPGWAADRIVAVGRAVAAGAELRGVMVHAGESYALHDGPPLAEAAEHERAVAVATAEALRHAGLSCPIVSVGSTPTACGAVALPGITELRAGVFMFFDLFMAGVGVCEVDNVALSVIATVIGQQPTRGLTLIDAGWMALSRDRGTARQPIDQGYGIVCDLAGTPLPGLLVVETSQEHGIIAARPGSAVPPPTLSLGTRVRILPNHACATAAQHSAYLVVQQPDPTHVVAVFDRFGGW